MLDGANTPNPSIGSLIFVNFCISIPLVFTEMPRYVMQIFLKPTFTAFTDTPAISLETSDVIIFFENMIFVVADSLTAFLYGSLAVLIDTTIATKLITTPTTERIADKKPVFALHQFFHSKSLLINHNLAA